MSQEVVKAAWLLSPEQHGLTGGLIVTMGCLVDPPAQSVVMAAWIAGSDDGPYWRKAGPISGVLSSGSDATHLGVAVDRMMMKARTDLSLHLPEKFAFSEGLLMQDASWEVHAGRQGVQDCIEMARAFIDQHGEKFRSTITMPGLRAMFYGW